MKLKSSVDSDREGSKFDNKDLKDFIVKYKKENCYNSCAECPCSWDVDGSLRYVCLLEIIAINIDKTSDTED